MSTPATLLRPFFADHSSRGRLRLTGRDRQPFLQGMVTGDVARLAPGEGCYAFQLDATGHVLADMRVLCAGDHLLLDVEPGLAPQVAETLEKYLIMERCRITDVTAETAQVFVGGPGAGALLEETLGVSGLSSWETEGQNAAFDFEGTPGLVAVTRLTSGPDFTVYLTAPGTVDALIARLAAGGAAAVTDGTLEALRIEAGIPRFGIDMDARVLAPETGQAGRAISYRKGCYIGQEIVARIDARGHTNRIFTGFRLAPGIALPTAADAPLTDTEGKEIGRVTSAALSPTWGIPIALGYIRNEHAAPGTAVLFGGQPATVAALPFAPAESDAAEPPVPIAAAER